ncbi:phage baseplate plug family protein [Bacillus thuringiensis]|uniref:phage baseplate plug family protein n=1 Tax=Bacillus thuringiensis TaxID=1428 RepID=UPI0037D679CB
MIFTTTAFLDIIGNDGSGIYDLEPTSEGKQSISISIAGYTYNIELYYNTVGQLWQATVTDISSNAVLCSSYALQYGRIAFGNWDTRIALLVSDKSSSRIGPMTTDDMGGRCSVYIVDKTAYPSVWPRVKD